VIATKSYNIFEILSGSFRLAAATFMKPLTALFEDLPALAFNRVDTGMEIGFIGVVSFRTEVALRDKGYAVFFETHGA
jgi:hypothetical protein